MDIACALPRPLEATESGWGRRRMWSMWTKPDTTRESCVDVEGLRLCRSVWAPLPPSPKPLPSPLTKWKWGFFPFVATGRSLNRGGEASYGAKGRPILGIPRYHTRGTCPRFFCIAVARPGSASNSVRATTQASSGQANTSNSHGPVWKSYRLPNAPLVYASCATMRTNHMHYSLFCQLGLHVSWWGP
jgi:hypothetical protein